MTNEQQERIREAEDILIHVMNDLRDARKDPKAVKKLDAAISRLENVLYD